MSDGLLKAEKDFTKEVDAAIPAAEAIGKVRIHFLVLLALPADFAPDRCPSRDREAAAAGETDQTGS